MQKKTSPFLVVLAVGAIFAALAPPASADGPVTLPPGWAATPPVIYQSLSSTAHLAQAGTLSPPYTPPAIRGAYGINALSSMPNPTGAGVTIAIVDAFGDTDSNLVDHVQSDLQGFCADYGLPYNGPGTAQPTLTEAFPDGVPTTTNWSWAIETALDVEWVHAVAPDAKILLVVASTNTDSLFHCITYGAQHAPVVSMSWGGSEWSGESYYDQYFTSPTTAYFASTGDSGAPAIYPAVSPGVTAVGGTSLWMDTGFNWLSETGWSGSGGGISSYEPYASFQSPWVASGNREVPDISAVADPSTGVVVLQNGTLYQVGGTSLSAPLWAAFTGLIDANSLSPVNETTLHTLLYNLGDSSNLNTYFHDIVSGNNGFNCSPGYDLVTGIGSPKVNAIIPAAVPLPPANLQASSGSSGITLTWSTSTGAVSYNLYRGTTSGGESATPIATGLTGSTYTDTAVVSGTTYYYKVGAVGRYCSSLLSNEVSQTAGATSIPNPPFGLGATPGNGQVSLTWTAVGNATSYNVYRGTTSGGESSIPIATGISGTSYADTGLANGTTYYYTVASVNTAGTSAPSSEVSAKPFSGPTQVTDPLNDWSIASTHTANWTFDTTTPSNFNNDPSRAIRTVDDAEAITYAFPNISAFSIVVFTKNASPSQVNILTSTNNGTSYSATGVNVGNRTTTANGWGYYTLTNPTALPSGVTNLEVQFLPGSGSAGDPELGSVTLTYTPTGPTVPAAPTGLTAVAGNAQVGLTWNASTGATSYNVYRGTTAGGESSTPIATGLTSTSYTDTGLTNGTTYFYTVTAVNGVGSSPMSNEASATPTTGTTGGPISIDCGGSAASPFVADTDFSGGTTGSTTSTVATPFVSTPIPPQAVLQSWRTGSSFTYTLGGFTPNTGHTVQLYFMDPTSTANGQRAFNVSINGAQVLTNFDVFAAAQGQLRAIQENFSGTANASGQIVISFASGSAGQPIVEGISVPN